MSGLLDFMKAKPIALFLLLVCVVVTLTCTLVFMPAAELMPAQVTAGPISPGLSPFRSEAIMNVYKGFADQVFGTDNLKELDTNPMPGGAPGDCNAYVKWAVFLSVAMAAAAIAINAVGRYDSEEKTTIPVKK